MATININLAVRDLGTSRRFFTALGLAINEDFSDENMVAVAVSDDIRVLLLTRDYFQTFTGKKLVDSAEAVEAIFAIGVDERPAVDAMADAALANGGAQHGDARDLGFLYSRSFTDPDGHIWEAVHMDFAGAEA